MRTTLDLPEELLKQAKIAAVQRGLTLRDLVASSLRRELGSAPPDREQRASLPSIKVADDAPVLRMTPAGIKAAASRADAEDDVRRSR